METIGIGSRRDRDSVGRNKTVGRAGGFYFHVGASEKSDVNLVGQKKQTNKLNDMMCIQSHNHNSSLDQMRI